MYPSKHNYLCYFKYHNKNNARDRDNTSVKKMASVRSFTFSQCVFEMEVLFLCNVSTIDEVVKTRR